MRRLARASLALYPLAFRRRYGDEMLALVEDSPASLRTSFDLLRGALAAHLRPPAGGAAALGTGDRLRASASAVLACWVVFAAAGLGFYKTTEDQPFSHAGDAHPAIGGAHLAIQVLAAVATLAVLAGALPLVVAALRQARGVPALRRATALAACGVTLGAIATVALAVFASSSRSPSEAATVAAFSAWALACLAGGGLCVAAARRGLFATRFRRRDLVAALACGTVATVAMALIAMATALYATAVMLDASALAGQDNGPIGAPGVGLSIALQLVVMITTAALASVSARRGWLAVVSQGSH